jgi:hypothetical protein
MRSIVLKNQQLFGLFLSFYALIGGFIGMYMVYKQMGPDTGLGSYMILVPIGVIYLLSFWGGIAYHSVQQRWRFYTFLKLVLCLQVIQFAVKGFTFIFYFGPYLSFGYNDVDAFALQFKLLTLNFSVWLGDAEVQGFEVNLVAIFLLMILRWLERAERTADQDVVEQFLQQTEEPKQQP